jgi:hypothetical protein
MAMAHADDALWVYGVARDGGEVPPELAVVSRDGLAAVASRVPLDEYGEEALRENLNDLGWLEGVARRHDRVLGELLGGGPVVPLRICTIYRDEDQLAAMLEGRASELHGALERLDGKAEWGVKAIAEPAQSERTTPASSGAEYIARKRQAAAARESAERVVAATVREGHARLCELASDAALLRAQNRELSGHRGEMVFNAAYLVDESRALAFAQAVDELGGNGVCFELTGPWPPYNFAEPAR